MALEFSVIEPDPILVEAGIHSPTFVGDGGLRNDYFRLAKDLRDYVRMGQDDKYYRTIRALARSDIFVLAYFILNLPVNHPFLIKRLYEAQDKPYGRMDLWGRGHWKTTIMTFVLPIFELIQNREERIAIFSHTRDIAKANLRRIKQVLEQNADLHRAFPEIFFSYPEKESPKWSENDGLIVQRRGTYIEASVEAWGLVDRMPTGKHFTIRIYDDIVTEKTVNSFDMNEKAIYQYKMSDNLKSKNSPRKRIVGTRYHRRDPYAEIMRAKEIETFTYPAVVNKDGEAAFPDDKDALYVYMDKSEILESLSTQGKEIFSAQMLQNPTVTSSQEFRPEWLTFYDAAPMGMYYYVIVDPASRKKKKSDYTTFIVIGTDQHRKYYVVDMVRDKLSLDEKWQTLLAMVQKWKPLEVGYEQYGMQNDIEYMQERMEAKREYFKINPLGGNTQKEDRIARLKDLFGNGRLLLPKALFYTNFEGDTKDLVTTFINEEYNDFPKSAHDDMLDAMARILDGSMKIIFPEETYQPEQTVKRFDPLSSNRDTNNNTIMSSWF